MQKERLQKILSQAGVCSRREAENLIKENKVKVNGMIAKLGDKASFQDEILVNNIPIKEEEKVYYVLNKPKKTISTLKDNFNRTSVVDLMDVPYKIFPVGRLDYDTTGVLIMTNDGELTNKLLHPKYQIPRVYRARLNEQLNKIELKKLNGIVKVNGVKSVQNVLPINEESPKSYFVILTQGTYHHVKELFKTVNKIVISLKRIEYAGITVDKMPLGTYRKLTIKEVKDLKNLVRIQEERLNKMKS
ncbi:pseudouridine synthase [Mycoplasmopsis felis]|uniref:pseudouridine synthase n=1 Tax=Mycoplasmopsis felis TaxID=33923 RepID=UPI0021AEFFA9|nr:pseudouridine synthase [Mycoplasmopsis felis]UWV79112.1 rRNA pseudouridine synthase [Mycoplasmopsis felis]UWV84534.1 rRNA pseudouridine synthase [Mycoplasmopsis felis]WQQ01371.1 pseudouridine synthase [Mycoplasmopsis felis]WQQ04076.1 pseudouridine synthase [Mycoplasmopsis felis]WQQ04504.1 pseudouridine synthase [Mycoplasmopsis felis]